MVMQLADGSLEDQVKAVARSSSRGPGGGLSERQFVSTMLQICEGLVDVHNRGTHRGSFCVFVLSAKKRVERKAEKLLLPDCGGWS